VEKFYPPGTELPFTEKTLPAHLRPYIVSAEEADAEPNPGDRVLPAKVS
jgi:hypothetical protein